MPIETEDGLGPLIDVAISHEHAASGLKPWTTNYQFASVHPFPPEDTADFITQIAAADCTAHLTVIDITKAAANRHIPKTTQPLGDTVVYNPSNHVEVALDLIGLQSIVGSDIFAHSTVLDFIRNPVFGNPGKIECRGLLTTAAVATTFAGFSLVNPSVYADIVEDWAQAIFTVCADHSCVWVLAGEPQMSITRSVVDNVFRTVKTFGDTIIRAILAYGLGSVRQDENDYKYFDVAP